MRLSLTVSAGLCAIPLCACAAVFSAGWTLHSVAAYTMERAAKGTLTLAPFNVGSRGGYVEIADQPNSAITISDRAGIISYGIDPANRTTTAAKRINHNRATAAPHGASKKEHPVNLLPLPEGCESAFSPYAAPEMALVIGRCIS
jgi:hypothetical protein